MSLGGGGSYVTTPKDIITAQKYHRGLETRGTQGEREENMYNMCLLSLPPLLSHLLPLGLLCAEAGASLALGACSVPPLVSGLCCCLPVCWFSW